MDGCFIFQRKRQNDEWTDFNELPLSRLRAEEWVKIDIRAAELLKLFEGLETYYELVHQHGLEQGIREFIPAPRSGALRALALHEGRFQQALEDDEELATALLEGLIAWIAGNERAVAAARLDGISLDQLQQFDAVLGLARLQRFCQELDDNQGNADEGYWQRTLRTNGWAVAQVYAVPIMLVQEQVYVGGKLFTNQMGNTEDFLYQNEIAGNVVLVEIKTPVTPLLGATYRNNVVNVSEELSGGLVQILHARQSLTVNYAALFAEDLASQRPLSPRGLLIVGSASELNTHARRESFELFRSNQREIDIVTFDELRRKIGLMIQLLENVAK